MAGNERLVLDLRPRAERGETRSGGLAGLHHFCFATYQRADRIHFGSLRKLSHYHLAPRALRKPELLIGYEVVTLVLKGTLHRLGTFQPREPLSEGAVELISPGAGVDLGVAAGDAPAEFVELWLATDARAGAPRRDWRPVAALTGAPLTAPSGGLLPWSVPAELRRMRLAAGAGQRLDLIGADRHYLTPISGTVAVGDLMLGAGDALAIERGPGTLSLTAKTAADLLWLRGL